MLDIPKNTLKKLYAVKRFSMAKIAKQFGCDAGTIQRIMRQYGIKSRTLSEAAEKIRIAEQTLKKLYYQNKLSTEAIGKSYRCSHATILNKMNLYGLKRRGNLGLRKPVIIPKKKLENLYFDRKLSQSQIAREMKCSRGAIVKLMKKYKIKSRSYSEANIKYPKRNFSEDLLEKAYLIGFRIGDLNVYRKDFIVCVRCSTTTPEQIQLIKDILSRYSQVCIRKSRILKGRQVFDVNCYLDNTFNFLLPKDDEIQKWILSNPPFFFAFLAGYIDAEGYIFVRLYKKSKTPTAGFQVQSYDKNILYQVWLKLRKLNIICPKPILAKPKGYESKLGFRNKKDMWRLSVNRKDALFKLLNSIKPYIKHGKRKQDLHQALQNLHFRLKIN